VLTGGEDGRDKMMMYINLSGDWGGHRSREFKTIEDEREGEIQTRIEKRVVVNKMYVTDCDGKNPESSSWNIDASGTPFGE
jgi:hypothetical protein